MPIGRQNPGVIVDKLATLEKNYYKAYKGNLLHLIGHIESYFQLLK